MFIKKQFRGIAIITLFIFTCFTLTLDYSYSQEGNPLTKAQELYKQGNFMGAVKILEAFIGKNKGNQTELKNNAEAYYLLARMNYDVGDGTQMGENLKLAVEADMDIGKEETNRDFELRVDQVREDWLKTEAAKSNVQEKEKPVPQIKKKKKFPWLLLAILGVGVVAALVVLLRKKKNDPIPTPNPTPAATYSNGVLIVSGVRCELASIPAGTFQMGSNSSEASADEQPVHTVQISKGFWMGKTEVTQGLWQAVMGSNPSNFKSDDNYPVETVSWDDCQSFVTKLNQMVGGNNFRLPTEAEWEYACRAGTTGDRYGDLDAIAWYSSNSGTTTHAVGQLQANAWGLFDTLGNVYEWCQDWYGGYNSSYQTDPTGPGSGSGRVIRGGSWILDARDVRAAFRYWNDPSIRNDYLGFRLAAGSAGG